VAQNTGFKTLLLQYDKLLVLLAAAALLVSLWYLTRAGIESKGDVAAYKVKLERPRQTAVISSAPAIDMPKSYKLDVPQAASAGLFAAERRVACIATGCKAPIPWGATNCVFCGIDQPTAVALRPDFDSDGDGIPDRREKAMGLNPNEAADAVLDADSDGFSNIEEFRAETDSRDPASHPDVAVRLRVKDVQGRQLPFMLMGINTMPDGKSQLTFSIKEPTGGTRTVWVKEGDAIAKTGFTAGKLTRKIETRPDPKLAGKNREYDVSTVEVVREPDGRRITLQINREGGISDLEAILVLSMDNWEQTVRSEGTFSLRNEKYRVLEIDKEAQNVVIMKESTGQKLSVPRVE